MSGSLPVQTAGFAPDMEHQPPLASGFVLKVAGRCNLDCGYCYMYNKGDSSFRLRPKFMSTEVVAAVLRRIADYAQRHQLPNIALALHGGEPLLLGRKRLAELLAALRAENRALDRKSRLSDTGPAVARTTAPVADIVRALNEIGLAADASSDSVDDVGSYLLYRVLADLPDEAHTPAVGLLRAPPGADEAAVKKAVKTAASVMAGQMALLPRF